MREWSINPVTTDQLSNMTQVYTQPFIPPMHERSSSYDQRTAKGSYSSQDFRSTDLNSSESRSYGKNIWKPRLTMPEHEKIAFEAPLPKVADIHPNRPEIARNPTREQLPPLSSLFGSPPTHQSRPALSPYLDHHSPLFPTASSAEARQTTIQPERSLDTSYFQRPGTARQYSYNSKPEPPERLGFPAGPRSGQIRASPETSRYESQHGVAEAPRGQHPSGWSPRSVASAPEYFNRDMPSSFKSFSEHRHQSSQVYRPEQECRPIHHDQAPNAVVSSNYPPTPVSTAAGETSTTKDGLGPKIWTGTQFLPRFVRQAEVSGEGMCYFYDDGTHCKTVIDGEIVNAHWGVTKAGKPRKRLAIACITCREKKIKCDPDYPRCVQCEKFGRVCKFKNAPRGGQGSPDTPSTEFEDLVPRPTSSRTDTESYKVDQREISVSTSPRETLRRATPESDGRPNKRQRIGYTDLTPVASEGSPQLSVVEPTLPSKAWIDTVNSPIDHNLLRDWQVNPYVTQPALVTELIAIFFSHVPETANCMFPEGPFTAWVLTSAEKSLDDLMLIYTILAFGTLFSSKPEQKALGIHFASISRYGCNNRQYSLQLVQARMLLSLYYFSTNNPNDSWDACGGAMRAASGLRLNVEFEKSEDYYLKTYPYGLNRVGYAECRRRTFWSCYLLDRFNGFSSGHFSIIHPEDVFLRLPCDANSFEAQREVQNPFFDPSSPPIQNTNWTIGPMAYVINISTIWGEIMTIIYRNTQRPVPARSSSAFMAFYETMTQRLCAWKDSLPTCYQFSAENLQKAAEGGKLGTLILMHAVYHTAMMRLNRYIQRSTLSTSQIAHHISVAQQHAEALLAMLDALAARRTFVSAPISPGGVMSASTTKFSSPFIGYAIISATDILTAKVTLATLPARLISFRGAQSVLAEVSSFWQSAKTQHALVLERIGELARLTRGADIQSGAVAFGFHSAGGAVKVRDGVYEMREPMEKTFMGDHDCVYA